MPTAKKFGTFGGVFTPSILTILGVIMYLRLPSIVGQAGLWTTVGIILVAHLISVATGLSVASIATDKKVQAGGTYYMLSRSLGLPIGGTLGLALFVGLSFSVSLYVIGFSESFLSYWGWEVSKNAIRFAGSITLVVVTAVTLISTALALKMQFFIMAAIVLSLLSIFFGQHDFAPAAPLLDSLPTAAPFIVLFGIFFPAVTGFEAGVSMSGDLQDAKKSIPSGTIWAIGVGLVVYIGLAAYFSFTVSADQLINNPNVLLDMALFAPAVVAGIWGATISSALGSILGAPRILQATASDRVVHKFFAAGYGKENEPRNALILTFIIAEAGILIGELDVIARIVSMFFITTYGFLNLSCYIESWASPDFRPDFRIPRVVSLLGALACFVVMIQLDFVAMIGASVLLGLVFLYLKRKELTLESGDTWEGFWSSLLRAGLQRLARSDVHERNWRPNILLFSFGTHARDPMMALATWLVHRRGLLSNFDLVVNAQSDRLKPRVSQVLDDQAEVEAGIFSRRLECPDAYEAMEAIATYHGFSGVEPNAVIMGWAGNSRDPERFVALLRRYAELDLNLLLLDIDRERGYGAQQTIDVWWRGGNNNISLTLALIRFLTSSDTWAGASIRFLVINEGDTAYSNAIQSRMDGILESFRIQGRAQVINNVVGRKPIHEIIGYESAKSDLTIIGMPALSTQNASAYMEDADRLLERLGTVLLVRASTFFNDLSVGIDTSPRGVDEAKALPPAVTELPALQLPEDETLRWAVQHAGDGIEAITSELADPALAAIGEMHRDLGVSVSGAIKRSLEALARGLDKQDRPRARRTIQRTQASLAFHLRDELASFMEEQLPIQQRLLETALVKERSLVRNLVRQTPEELQRPVDRLPAGEHPSLIERLTNRSRTVVIPFRDLVEARGTEALQRLILKQVEETGRAVHAFSEQTLVLLQNAFDALHRVALRIEEGDAVAALSAEQDHIQSAWSDLLGGYQQQHRRIQEALRLGARELVQDIASEVHTGSGRQQRDRAEQDRLSAALLDAPRHWEENQRLLMTRAALGIQLISFQMRLRTIAQRYQEEVALSLQNNLARPVRDMEKEVHAALASLRSDAGTRIRPAFSVPATFDLKGIHQQFVADVRAAVEELPESVRTLSEQAVQLLVDRPLDDVDIITVSLRRVVDYIVEMELLGPINDELADWPGKAQRLFAIAQDVMRLVSFHVDEEPGLTDAGEVEAAVNPLLQKGLERLQAQLTQLEHESDGLVALIGSRLDTAVQQLNPYTITRTEGDLQRYVRGHTGRQIQSRFRATWERAHHMVRDGLVRLLYSRSEGVLFARQLQEADPYLGAAAHEGLRLVDAVSPDATVMRGLPLYYRQLFLDLPNITQEFWVGAEPQIERAHQAVDRWTRGVHGGLLVLGEAYSGKTALCQLVAQTYFKRDAIFHLNPVPGGTCDPVILERELKRALGIAGTLEEGFAQLPAQSVLILNDLERWWERSPDGTAALALIAGWMERYGRQCFFLINANVHAFKLIDRIHPVSGLFLDIVTRSPSNAEQIKNVILLRHRSAGMTFTIDGEPEDRVSAWTLARLFTSLFDYARGNVGAALHAWIVAIDRVGAEGIAVAPLSPPDASVVDTLSPIQRAIVVHLLLHGTLTGERLHRISSLDETLLRHEMHALQRLGWVVEREQGVLAIDRFLLPHLTRACVERRLLG
ncbi:MAG: hypothetical protein R2834_09365 [Rhodothermales bacterium]